MQSKATFRVLNIDSILPNRFQPRLKFEDESLDELASSISRFGVIEPIVVRPIGDKYEIIAGERRYKASKLASMSTIPSIVVNLSDKDSEELALLENVQRQQLNPIEEAVSYKRILDMGYVDLETLAKKIGKPQSAILAKVRLLNLSDEVQSYLLNGKISERHARALLNVSNIDSQVDMLHRIVNERLTVRQTNREIRKLSEKNTINEGSLNEKGADVPMDIDKIMKEAKDINVEQPVNAQAPDLMARGNMPEQPVSNAEGEAVVNPTPEVSSFDSMFNSPVNLVPTPEPSNDLLNEVSSVATSPSFNASVNSGEPLETVNDVNSNKENSSLPFDNPVPDVDIVEEQPVQANPGMMTEQPVPANPGMMPEQPVPAEPGMMPEQPVQANPGMMPEQPVQANPGMMPEQPVQAEPGMMPEQPVQAEPGMMPEQPVQANPGMMPEQPVQANPGIMPEQPVQANPGITTDGPTIPDFAKIIKQLRDCADEIEKSGHFVNLEEVDLGNQYKVIFTFDK